MWQAVENILISRNGLLIIAMALVIVFLSVRLSKRGFLSIDTKYVKLGTEEKERSIIRQQIEWSRTFARSLEYYVLDYCQSLAVQPDIFKVRFVLSMVHDEVEDWVTFNHIMDETTYIDIKKEKVRAIVFSITNKSIYRTEAFVKMMDDWTETTIKQLVKIRKVYTGK